MEDRNNLCVVSFNDNNHTLASVLTAPEPLTQQEWSNLLNEADDLWEFIDEADNDELAEAGVTQEQINAYNDGLVPLFLLINPTFTGQTAAEYSY